MTTVLGIESSCDETGVALVQSNDADSASPRLLAQALHSQVQMHQAYGGVVPELASRDHIRRLLPLARTALREAGLEVESIDVVAYTRGPGLAGALLVGAGAACALAAALDVPVLGVHHLEGHLLSPFLSADPPRFPFVALLVSGGHTQLMRVDGVGEYRLLGETIDDAAGEAFDKTAKLMGLGYPGGPALARLAELGDADAFRSAATAAAQRRPRLFVRRVEDGGTDATSTPLQRLRTRPGRPRSRHAGRDRRGAGQEVAARVAADRARAFGGGRWRRRQCRTAPRDGRRLRAARRTRALSGAGAVHRQRRNDRARCGDAAAKKQRGRVEGLRLRRQAALGLGRASSVQPPSALAYAGARAGTLERLRLS